MGGLQRDVVARSQDFHGLYCEYFTDKKNHERKQQLLLKTSLRFSVQYIRCSSQLKTERSLKAGQRSSVENLDPNPDPEPHVFGPPGSGSRSCSGSGSGYFYPQAKKIKENLDSYCFVTSFWLFIFENDVHVPSKSNKKKKLFKKLVFCWHLGKVNDENSRIRIRIQIGIRIRIQIH